MRILLPAILLALAACGSGTPSASSSADEEERIFCRIGAAGQFERLCTVERGTGEAGPTLTVRKPDGGFRRLLLTEDGVAAADGAEEAEVTRLDADTVEVEIGGDAFRLPASVHAP